jgi:hypothetical protein
VSALGRRGLGWFRPIINYANELIRRNRPRMHVMGGRRSHDIYMYFRRPDSTWYEPSPNRQSGWKQSGLGPVSGSLSSNNLAVWGQSKCTAVSIHHGRKGTMSEKLIQFKSKVDSMRMLLKLADLPKKWRVSSKQTLIYHNRKFRWAGHRFGWNQVQLIQLKARSGQRSNLLKEIGCKAAACSIGNSRWREVI